MVILICGYLVAKEYESGPAGSMTDTVETSTLGLEFHAQSALEIVGIDPVEELTKRF